MKFSNITIKNFRNFEKVNINLDNKNVIFGMNDIGKTNFLYALRFLLDKEIRKFGFNKSDYHKHDTSKKIEIILTLDLSDYEKDEDTKKLISVVKGARTSANADVFYIALESKYDDKELYGNIILKWGSELDNLIDIPGRGNINALDNVFKVIYINPLVDLDKLFAQNKKYIFEESQGNESDEGILNNIKSLTDQVNQQIGEMTIIKGFQQEITSEYRSLKKEEVSIELKSEMAIKGFFSDIIPYIKKDGDSNYYPTSGDGRRKMLSYSIYNYLAKKKYEDKIVIYLIEEPEISLHRSMQIALSKQLFEQSTYKYFFLSTHSPELLYEMDNTRLIRVHSTEKVVCSSHMYNVEEAYGSVKKKLNKALSSALFAERVLLIEGPSEKILFEKVLDEVEPEYELNGGFLLEVGGTYFNHYVCTLNDLGITHIIKTDNDLKSKKGKKGVYELLGLNRCLNLLGRENLDEITIDIPEDIKGKKKKERLNERKKEIFKQYKNEVGEFLGERIYLSEIDLENDLYSAIGESMKRIFEHEDPVHYLQKSKLFNMVELVNNLSTKDCFDVFEHEKFACLKELVGSDRG
ncbi:ATP-dependent endonuclease [Bacillus toyonensis]|nr:MULTISPECIES: Gabija anti-phage system endonuclease GajA [Bacillus cereus group]PES52337.1 ATP-dependent endonuclease [Bacillus thuringiensis]PHD01674.1 ATP-dependent endonuclease [Bacillus toyonensis]